VALNRADLPDAGAREFCAAQRIPLLAEIPDDRRLAEAYSRGELACEALPEAGERFAELLEAVVARAAAGREVRGVA
jgi:MinD superfamily P-loop ATPase